MKLMRSFHWFQKTQGWASDNNTAFSQALQLITHALIICFFPSRISGINKRDAFLFQTRFVEWAIYHCKGPYGAFSIFNWRTVKATVVTHVVNASMRSINETTVIYLKKHKKGLNVSSSQKVEILFCFVLTLGPGKQWFKLLCLLTYVSPSNRFKHW